MNTMRNVLLSLLLVLSVSPVLGALNDSDVLGAWRFDGDYEDQTTFNNDFFPRNTIFGPGFLGSNAVQFNGADSWINLTTDLGIWRTTGSAFTVAMWVQHNVTSGDQGYIYDRFPGAGDDWFSFKNSNSLGVAIQTGATQIVGNLNNFSTWSLVVFTADDTLDNQTLYVDGTFKTSSTAGATGNKANSVIVVGSAFTSVFMNGFIDEVTIWNRTLSDSEVTELYNGGAGCQYPFTTCAALSILQNTYNVTSAYLNGTAWRTNENATVFTYDATPTATFDISEAGNCTVSNAAGNYTTTLAGDANTLCATTSSTSQSCTLPLSQHLVEGNQFIYIACKSNTDRYVESGPLNITMDPVGIDNQTYNVTNAFLNGTAWRINQNNTVFMRNRIPIVNFNTSVEANCSISRYQFNYTAMLANDSASDCGDNNNVSHSCELPLSMQLINGAQFLYIGCTSLGAESVSSTSVGLNISMDRPIIVQVIRQSGATNVTHENASVYVMNQADNVTVDEGPVNSTGGIELFVPNAGTYLVYGYDHSNSSIEGDVKNHVVIS